MYRLASAGFTLIELLIALSIFIAVGYLGLSFIPDMYKKNQFEHIVDDIRGAIRFARVEALLTGDSLILTHPADSPNWSSGLVLWRDFLTPKVKGDRQLIYDWRWKSKDISVTWHGFQSNDALQFNPDISRNAVNGYFLIEHKLKKVKLVINRIGRMKVLR